jgi:long-chain acyl-CoA synthetase
VLAVVEDQEQVDKLLSIAEQVPTLSYILYDEERGLRDYDHSLMQALPPSSRRPRRDRGSETDALLARIGSSREGKGSDLAIILYTSGTTGRPKGVMLTYDNVIAAARSAAISTSSTRTTRSSPICRWPGSATTSSPTRRRSRGLVRQLPREPRDRRRGPPRDRHHLRLRAAARLREHADAHHGAHGGCRADQAAMFGTSSRHANKVGEKILNRRASASWDRMLYALGDFLVYSPLRNRFGLSNIKVGYTAGEAIGPEIFRFYRSIGVNLKQLYGQTEASVYVTMQPDGEIHADTVGRPAPGVEIKIDDNGEVLFRSPGVFQGYYKDPEKTAETKTADGFVRSGDAGFFDANGHLKIIDRAKDVGKLNDGSLFPPKYVENKLKFYPNIKEVVAFGNGRDYVTCFINIDLTAVGNWAERNNVIYGSYQELAQNPQVYEMIASMWTR